MFLEDTRDIWQKRGQKSLNPNQIIPKCKMDHKSSHTFHKSITFQPISYLFDYFLIFLHRNFAYILKNCKGRRVLIINRQVPSSRPAALLKVFLLKSQISCGFLKNTVEIFDFNKKTSDYFFVPFFSFSLKSLVFVLLVLSQITFFHSILLLFL